MTNLLRPLRLMLLPLVLTIGAIALLPRMPTPTSPWAELLPWLPLLMASLVLILGWRFNSSRSLLATAIILLCYALGRFHPSSAALLTQATLLLVPLNLALLTFYAERGVLTRHGLWRLGLIGFQALGVFWICSHQSAWVQQWLNPGWLPLPGLAQPLSEPVLASLGLGSLWLALRWLRDHEPLDAYLLVTLGLCLWPLVSPPTATDRHLLVSLNLMLWLLALLKRSHDMAYLDDLTGMPGRRALNEALLRLGRRYTVAMLDVDHFKKFNDTYGHDVGDQVLKLVASRLKRVRDGSAYRYGGEEFCILFPRRDLKQVLEPLEEIRTAVEQAELQLRSPKRPRNESQGKTQRGARKGAQRSVSVTISIGAAEHKPKQDSLKQADQALYRAKKQGRNRVCF